MIIFGREITYRTIALIGGIILLMLAAALIPGCLSKWRLERAQSRVEASQAEAASNSAADAINAVSEAGKRETESEELTRDNERDIRAADGAGERVKSGVDYAGRSALCRREAYRNDPRCKP